MKKEMKAVVVAAFLAMSVSISAMAQTLEQLRFTIQFHDIAVELLKPSIDKTSSSRHPVITGCHVTIVLSDRFEMVAPPQCHWDGVSEKSRYSYTLCYRLKGGTSLTTYSLNLRDFNSTSEWGECINIISMGIIPDDGIVNFKSASIKDIAGGADPRQVVELKLIK